MTRWSILALPAALAAQVTLGGSHTGFVFDELRHEIRPVIGEPGAAYLGAAVVLPFRPEQVWIRNGGAAAIAIAKNEEGAAEAWRIGGLKSGALETVRLASAESAWVSTDGNLALLASEGHVRLVSGSIVGDPVPRDSLPGPLGAVAFQPEPECAILATANEEHTAIVHLCAGAPAEPRVERYLEPTVPTAMTRAFGVLWIADRASSRLLRVGESVDTAAEGLDDAAGIQAVSRSELAIAHRGGIAVVDTANGSAASIDLPLTPDRLEYLAPGRILVCNRLREDPVLVIDLEQNRETFFIPLPGGTR
ncbi:MAG: hypothetical protein R2729_27785 [Bryobacteraceae bacterium]